MRETSTYRLSEKSAWVTPKGFFPWGKEPSEKHNQGGRRAPRAEEATPSVQNSICEREKQMRKIYIFFMGSVGKCLVAAIYSRWEESFSARLKSVVEPFSR